MICPMCESGKLRYRSLTNDEAMNNEKETHIYVCEECPAVLIEWYDESDSIAFLNSIK